jgi:hypothetical protein
MQNDRSPDAGSCRPQLDDAMIREGLRESRRHAGTKTYRRSDLLHCREGLCRTGIGSSNRSPSGQPSLGPISRTSAEAPGEPAGAGVDTALPSHELVQRLGIRLVRCRVTHYPRPLAPGSFVGLGRGVHRMIAANGSSRSDTSNRCKRSARRARSIARSSAAHQETKPYTAVKYP